MGVSIAFGPVPARRLGRSLGVNHVPPKVCSYSCVYCQVGRTERLTVEPRAFYGPEAVADAVRRRVDEVRAEGEVIDHLTLVPDGEPTLDADLPRLIGSLRPLGIPIAVLTNGSLVARPDVRAALDTADYVSLKVDAAREATWRRVDRPHGTLRLDAVLRSLRGFARGFRGTLTTETMLVGGVNDGPEDVRATARFLARLGPNTAYLAVPTRPPAEPWVRPPSGAALARAWDAFRRRLPAVELLTGYEGDAFASTGDATRDLLSITAVHPLRSSAVGRLLRRTGQPWSTLTTLLDARLLQEVEYGGEHWFLRPVTGVRRPPV